MESIQVASTDRLKEMNMSINKTTTRKHRLLSSLALVTLAFGAVAACGSDKELSGVDLNPDQLFWSLDFNYHGVTLSTDASRPEYNTLQLIAVPRTVNGDAIEGLGRPTFTSSDTTAVVVDSTGLITARKAKAAPVMIVARLASPEHQLTNYDTAYVVVTDDVNPPASFAISTGRTTYGIGYDTIVKARLADAAGDPITGVKVSYWSSDPGVASIDTGGVFQPKKEGVVKIAASTISYGVFYTDTLTLTIGPPEVFEVSLVAGPTAFAAFYPAEVTIKAGQGIAWNSSIATGAKYGDVTFDDPTNVGPSPVTGESGNMAPFILRKNIRTFPIPGTYTYQNTLSGDRGTIIVTP